MSAVADTEPVRRHLLELSRQGIGLRAVAQAADISASTIGRIRKGQRCSPSVASRILSIDQKVLADYAMVPGDRAWRLIDELLERGYSKTQLARWMGLRQLSFGRDRMRARSELRVLRMWTLESMGRLSRP